MAAQDQNGEVRMVALAVALAVAVKPRMLLRRTVLVV